MKTSKVILGALGFTILIVIGYMALLYTLVFTIINGGNALADLLKTVPIL